MIKIRYIVSMSGASDTFPAFEKDNKGNWVYYKVDELEAVNLIKAEYAIPENQEEYETALAKIEELQSKKEADKKLAEDIAELDDLKNRESELLDELSEVQSRIERVEIATGQKELSLLDKFKQDKSIIDDLKSDDLKELCVAFDIEYTKVEEAKEALKKVEA